MDNLLPEELIDEVIKRVKKEAFIEVEASGRHVHVDTETLEALFGEGHNLTKTKDLSQPGQFACKERVTIIGPKGSISNVVILGPERKNTQVEISQTDALILGIKAPVRESGNIEGTPPVIIASEKGAVRIEQGVIVAKRHVHITPEDAEKFKVRDKEKVKVQIFGDRPLIFDDVVVRVSPNFRTYMHIDYDEANACGFTKGTLGKIIK
ncbi:ethanolamine utilization phosphate acetyltransferase EutD [uncultured Clostridium sp.]|uniref:ethanolamine utilization phosphate acetyltransferase EutD n=1 Tax=uncultured Clostridium sp. TaxID=59620 RepID=UPI0028E64A6F|nr:ethanolamine utilization phosphate acetyltransferase EutD [uncultured Clostridium sp.]